MDQSLELTANRPNMPPELVVAYARAAELAGREVFVEPTVNDQYIVVWLNAMDKPPRPGSTELEALELFIDAKSKAPVVSEEPNDP